MSQYTLYEVIIAALLMRLKPMYVFKCEVIYISEMEVL